MIYEIGKWPNWLQNRNMPKHFPFLKCYKFMGFLLVKIYYSESYTIYLWELALEYSLNVNHKILVTKIVSKKNECTLNKPADLLI